jgi:hypothetical protein
MVKVCAPEGPYHLCRKLFLPIDDEHVGSVGHVLSHLILNFIGFMEHTLV